MNYPGVPKALQDFLEDTSVIKAGVNIQGDAHKLFKDYDLSMSGMLDLVTLRSSLKPEWRKDRRFGLRLLVAEHLQQDLLKDEYVRRSDWDRYPLSKPQELYAANDAYATYKVAERLLALHAETGNELVTVDFDDILARKEKESKKRVKVDRRPDDDFFSDLSGGSEGSSADEELPSDEEPSDKPVRRRRKSEEEEVDVRRIEIKRTRTEEKVENDENRKVTTIEERIDVTVKTVSPRSKFQPSKFDDTPFFDKG
ncbi:hypothetical protein HDV00_000402 [Rhizophlyctis rosea]|nr:hypothetical protein HDV00_000402 [Rhizophlyctis rosea]